MAFAPIATAKGVGTTNAVNTTGANLLVLVGAYDGGAGVSDSKGNTWVPLNPSNPGNGTTAAYCRIWYCLNPTVGAGHTATITLSYGVIHMLAFSGAAATTVLNGQTTGALGFSPGTTMAVSNPTLGLTPTEANCLIISGLCMGDNGNTFAQTGGYTTDSINATAGTSYGGAAGYKIQSAAALERPVWTWTSTSAASCALAVFRSDGVAAGGPPITTQPANQTVAEGATATFSVVATGATGYQWRKNGTNIGGAVSASYTTPATTSGDNGATFSVAASDGSGTTISSNATLTVTGGAPGTLTTSLVQTNGRQIALTFTTSTTPLLSQLSITVDGYPFIPSTLTGSGTSWTVAFGKRWIKVGSVVQVVFNGGSTVTATNNSIVTRGQVQFVGREFGLFVHFGLETWLNVEWSEGGVPADFALTGNIGLAIDQWIAGAVSAGMKYIILTTKHHSGFCLWPSASTTFDIAATPWYAANGNPDIVRIFCAKVRAAGLGVGLYFSGWDRKFEALNPGFTSAAYIAYTQIQLTELFTRYGKIDMLWVDGQGWLAGGGIDYGTLPTSAVMGFVKTLQPECQVLVNDHRGTFTTTDILGYEVPFEGGVPTNNLVPVEAADTIRADNAWFYKTAPDSGKTLSALNTSLADTIARNGTLLLNVPPNRDGFFTAANMTRLAEMGQLRLEQVGRAAAPSGSYVAKKVQVTLTSNGSTILPNLTNLKYAFYDEPTPNKLSIPTISGIDGTTDAAGIFRLDAAGSSLPIGGIGQLTITNSNGTTSQDPAALEVTLPVAVAAG